MFKKKDSFTICWEISKGCITLALDILVRYVSGPFFRVGTKSSDCNFFSCAGMERGIGTQAWRFYKKITCLVGFVPP